jgi:hypothetical protein
VAGRFIYPVDYPFNQYFFDENLDCAGYNIETFIGQMPDKAGGNIIKTYRLITNLAARLSPPAGNGLTSVGV